MPAALNNNRTILNLQDMKKTLIITTLALGATAAWAQGIKYPATVKGNTVDVYFGDKVEDPYRWLENDTSRQTAQWVEAQNKVTDAYLAKIPFRNKILKRLKELADYEKIGMPFKKNDKWYVFKNNGLQNQSVLYVMDRPGGEQRVFLDPNTLSADGTVALKGTFFSHNGKYMAYTISRSGSDWEEIYVMDVKTGRLLDDHITWAKFTGAEWHGDGFYYSAYDKPEDGKELSSVNEGHKIYYHKMGTPQSQDVLFYQNAAYPQRFYGVSVNKKETMMFLFESGAGAGNNLFVRDLRKPGSQFIQMTSDHDCQYSPVDVDGDKIILFTNYKAPKNRLMLADVNSPGVGQWKELVPEGDNMLEDVTVTDGRMVLTYNKDASNHSYLYDMQGRELCEIELPSVGSVGFSGEKDQKECFFSFTSFTVPSTVYQFDPATGSSRVFVQPKVRFDTRQYASEQIFFTSKDGTRVPMSITYKKGMKLNGANPVYLYGYGGFNISLPPYFSTSRIPFLESGGIYVQVNLRGGSEYGEEWHLAGTKMNKQNVFDDFIAAAQYLIDHKYTRPDRIAIVGGSNGGLLVGACMTQRPELFGVAIPQVGVMDMLRYHKFTIGWNWAPDYGTSDDSPEMYRYLKAYSPLHNLKPGVKYPATMVTTADHDDRVVPAHSFKFAARLQECNGGTRPTLIRIDSKAGHGGGKPLSKALEEQADIYGFILYNMGVKFK